MRGMFQKNDPTDGPIRSPPPLPLTPTVSTPSLIPKPPGEVGCISHGGYSLKDVLEQQHRWEDGLYHKIRV